MSFTIGSLFDGSGGFPLAASLCGGTPIWAAEVEPYPIAVTTSRFPNMKHLGSVTDVKGNEVEPVDVLCFGAPCQDLSVAGLRKGLRHDSLGDGETTRSGLFMEAVRIIKEMREATNGVYPRFAIYENVPGAFSSSKGEDFRIVLEELIKVVEPTAVMPEVPKKGWPYADSYCGDGWSIAYRVFDAQYWGKSIRDRDSGTMRHMGTPQRRRRIYLVLDLGGQCARKVLFERDGLRGHYPSQRSPWQGATAETENSTGADDRVVEGKNGIAYGWPLGFRPENVRVYEETATTICNGTRPGFTCGIVERIILDDQCGQHINIRTDGKSPTLRAEMHGNLPCVMEPVVFDGANVTSPVNASNPQPGDPCHTLSTDSRNILVEPVYCPQGNGIDRADTAGCNGKGVKEDVCYTLNTIDRPAVAYCIGNGQADQLRMSEKVGTLDCMHDQKAEVYGVACRNATEYPESMGAIQATMNHNLNSNGVVRIQYIVRRLTPTECARLQGFPDTWGHPIEKTELTDEEYQFWLNVRDTHATINDKATKDYTKDQILKWYNGLHTDSSEYKMWGNGVALPNALYVMQGIADVMSEEKATRRKWLDDLLGGCL